MYRTYHLTEKEKEKITKMRWDGDTHYYDVFENQKELEEEEKRLAKIEEDCKRRHEEYLRYLESLEK